MSFIFLSFSQFSFPLAAVVMRHFHAGDVYDGGDHLVGCNQPKKPNPRILFLSFSPLPSPQEKLDGEAEKAKTIE